jgi:hypothetical protein
MQVVFRNQTINKNLYPMGLKAITIHHAQVTIKEHVILSNHVKPYHISDDPIKEII